jgi:hypothetical protein
MGAQENAFARLGRLAFGMTLLATVMALYGLIGWCIWWLL